MTTEPAHDTGYAPPQWKFDDEVTRVFDNMLDRSIPDYLTMRSVVADLAGRFLARREETYTPSVLDLGASLGQAIAPLMKRFGGGAHYTALETSEPMLRGLRERYSGWIHSGVLDVRSCDLREGLPVLPPCDVALSVLTLMFVPVERRQHLLGQIAASVRPGGAFILVEKVLGGSARMQETLVDEYHQLKERNGYTREEVDRKALALEGVLVPATAEWNEEQLGRSGFGQVECVWRCLNFAAWLAIR